MQLTLFSFFLFYVFLLEILEKDLNMQIDIHQDDDEKMFVMNVKQIKSWFKHSKLVFVKKSGGVTYIVRRTYTMVLIKETVEGYSPDSITQIIGIVERKLNAKLKLITFKTVKSKRRIIMYNVYEIM